MVGMNQAAAQGIKDCRDNSMLEKGHKMTTRHPHSITIRQLWGWHAFASCLGAQKQQWVEPQDLPLEPGWRFTLCGQPHWGCPPCSMHLMSSKAHP